MDAVDAAALVGRQDGGRVGTLDHTRGHDLVPDISISKRRL